MKVYIAINSNHEGTNFLGVYSTREKCEEQIALRENKQKAELRELYIGRPKELERALEHWESWDKAKCCEHELDEPIRSW